MSCYITELNSLADPKFKVFQQRILPNTDKILGVRLPEIRKIAKKIAKADWDSFLKSCKLESFEEKMLCSMVIGEVKVDFNRRLMLVEEFIPHIDNWSVCDSFVASLKFVKNNRDEFLLFLAPYFTSGKEYHIRFAIVCLLWYYNTDDYLDSAFLYLKDIKEQDYYIQMAIAWAISAFYLSFPERTTPFLLSYNKESFIYKKAVQKILDSKTLTHMEKQQVKLQFR